MPTPTKKQKFKHTLLIDGDSLIKTAYHGAKNLYYKENHIGGIFQFLTMVRKMLNEHRYDRVFVFWDGIFSGRLRYDIYKDYKGNRNKNFYEEQPPSEPELYIQKERVKGYCEELFIRQFNDEVVEADDGIAYYCNQISNEEKVVIMTNDRDMLQLLNEKVAVYVLNLKTIVSTSNFSKYFNYHHSNTKLLKMISGDASDNIKGIKGVSEKTLIKYFPEICNKSLTLEEIFSNIEVIQSKRKNRLTTLDNIINKVTVGVQGDSVFEVNEKIINLKKPLLTEQSKHNLDDLFSSPIDPENRSTKNVIKMMLEDGLTIAIPGGRDGYVNFLQPFLRIIKKEKNYFSKIKN